MKKIKFFALILVLCVPHFSYAGCFATTSPAIGVVGTADYSFVVPVEAGDVLNVVAKVIVEPPVAAQVDYNTRLRLNSTVDADRAITYFRQGASGVNQTTVSLQGSAVATSTGDFVVTLKDPGVGYSITYPKISVTDVSTCSSDVPPSDPVDFFPLILLLGVIVWIKVYHLFKELVTSFSS